MGGKKNLFFPIRQGWDSNKVAAIIDGEAYRTLESYSIWGKEEHIDSIVKGRLLLEKQDENIPAEIVQVDPARMDTLIRSGKAALVTVIPEDQQINDTINVLPHTVCNVPGCNKPMQPTTPEENIDMLFRGERESAPSPELGVLGTQPMGNQQDTDEPDPNPYTLKLLDLKQEPWDPDLEEVLNQEIRPPTIEERILEVRHIMEEDRELREQEISGVLQIMDQGQNEIRENIKIILEVLNENRESLQAQTNIMKEAFTLLNQQTANQLRLISEQVAKLAREIRVAITPPPPLPQTVVQPMSESFYTSPTGEIQRMTACAAGEAEEALARAEAEEALARARTVIPDSTESTRESSLEPILFPFRQKPTIPTPTGGATSDNNRVSGISVEPGRDSYVEGNAPICNLGTSGAPPPAPRKSDAEPIRDPDTHMINHAADCQPGLNASQYADTNPRAGVAEMSVIARVVEEARENKRDQPKRSQTEDEIKAEIRQHEAETEAMIQKADANPLLVERRRQGGRGSEKQAECNKAVEKDPTEHPKDPGTCRRV
ncbi:hypothetical protein L211DRAFT_851851 [Terfezia boudieri ATCC MYA-4762]|uniref:Uncharacterized protein n=1 Tax=Terfezia boudieri ATCC MYA-4762 TaxID=1051890 RepID=A0A3N4LDK1_9PEZI|nr:hypothetical protein L211DRAFT_851851 [Terfezia boudieri ATCC MYA-4762]